MNVKQSKLKSVRVHGQKVNRKVFRRRTWKRQTTQRIFIYVCMYVCIHETGHILSPSELLFFTCDSNVCVCVRVKKSEYLYCYDANTLYCCSRHWHWLTSKLFRLIRHDNNIFFILVCECAHVKSWSDWLISFRLNVKQKESVSV